MPVTIVHCTLIASVMAKSVLQAACSHFTCWYKYVHRFQWLLQNQTHSKSPLVPWLSSKMSRLYQNAYQFNQLVKYNLCRDYSHTVYEISHFTDRWRHSPPFFIRPSHPEKQQHYAIILVKK